MRCHRIATGLLVALALAGCSGSGDRGEMTKNERTGTTAGAAGGAAAAVVLMAAGPIGIAVGAISGAMKGNRVGSFLDGDAKKRSDAAAVRAASTGRKVTWTKTDMFFQTEASGWARPAGKPYFDDTGRACRHVIQSATQKDRTEKDTVTLCKSAGGWAVVSPTAEASAQKPPGSSKEASP
jgi:surface antigen